MKKSDNYQASEKNIAALRYLFKYYIIYTNLVLHIFPDGDPM